MGKLYEALERAEEELKRSDKAKEASDEITIEKETFEKPPMMLASERSIPSSALLMEDEMMALYQSMNALLPDAAKKTIQFIGSREDEGTSTIIREFAMVSVMKFGKSVLLLDADSQKYSQYGYFDIKPTYKLEDAIHNDIPTNKVLHQVDELSLYVSQFHINSPFTAEFFDPAKRQHYWKIFRKDFDFILIDSPPATLSSVSSTIADKVDGIVLVLESEKTRWPVAERVKTNIIKNGGKILGLVMNKKCYHIPDFIYKRL